MTNSDVYALIGLMNAVRIAEAALVENIQYLTDVLELRIRQGDSEAIRKLQQLTDAWVLLCRAIKLYEAQNALKQIPQ